jgi:hypothetical protein
MLEIHVPPAPSRPLHHRANVSSTPCAPLRRRWAAAHRIGAAMAASALLPGCAAPNLLDTKADEAPAPAERDPGPAGEGGAAPAVEVLSAPIWDTGCVAGAWITPHRVCACPPRDGETFTAECDAPDCQEADLLLMWPWGEAIQATLRLSASEERLSSAGDPLVGTWEHLDDGELHLEFDENALYIPTECRADELQMKGHPTLQRSSPALAEALFWGWLVGKWTDVPYFP